MLGEREQGSWIKIDIQTEGLLEISRVKKKKKASTHSEKAELLLFKVPWEKVGRRKADLTQLDLGTLCLGERGVCFGVCFFFFFFTFL